MSQGVISAGRGRFLKDIASAVVRDSRVLPGQTVAGHGPNATGVALIRPGGRDCYPAFWIRDFAMSLESGLITPGELEDALFLTARLQAPVDTGTQSGSFIPRGSIADHITFAGQPIFFPGTLDDVENQGGPWGRYPSLDNHFFFIEMAWRLAAVMGREKVLKTDVDGMSLMERLELGFSVPPVADDTGLVHCKEENRGVSFGFTDTVVHTGYLLFCSLLRYRAAGQMAELYRCLGRGNAARRYARMAGAVAASVPREFGRPGGLLRASTGKSAQPDVWGSAYAVYSGALNGPEAEAVSHALLHACREGTVSWKGSIRHVPADAGYSDGSPWEQLVGNYRKNSYQNGAYWSTPTGWVCFALARVSRRDALQLAREYIGELQSGDYRLGDGYGSPYECMHPENNYRRNPVYMTSVTCPLAAFHRLGWLPE